ncbi:MAG: hypothetical protein JWQ71_4123 [Pedosphaera sp.]|nr:hypothetical protein [Pedosphaera sp.]
MNGFWNMSKFYPKVSSIGRLLLNAQAYFVLVSSSGP